jgi:hypothetical protein
MGPVLFWATLALAPMPLLAQQPASLGLGSGVVRYPGGSSFSILTAAPSVQHFSPFIYLGAGGSVSLLEGGVWAGQARGDLWAAFTHRARGFRPAVSTTVSATTWTDGAAAASASGVVESIWTGAGSSGGALGAGAVTGVVEGLPGVTALRLRGRGWWQSTGSPAQLSLTVEGNRFLDAWYTDLVGGLNFDRDRVVASAWVSARLSGTYGSSGAASATFQYYVTPTIALEASGGNYLADPYQGLPRAGFVAGGVRVFTSRRLLQVVTPASTPTQPVLQPLIALHRGDTLVVRFRMTAARSVAIAGNWNAWTPAPLRNLGEDIWEATLRLAPGVYYFNLVVDGNDWVVPGGVATVPDGMGGVMAVLNVL